MNEDRMIFLSHKSDPVIRECPFCGDEFAPLLVREVGSEGWFNWYVACSTKTESPLSTALGTHGCGARGGVHQNAVSAVKAWNERVTDPTDDYDEEEDDEYYDDGPMLERRVDPLADAFCAIAKEKKQ